MRVLQIGLSKFPGGIEAFVMAYFRQLIHKDVIFDFVDIYGEGLAFENEIKSLGGKLFTTPNYKKHPMKATKTIIDIIIKNGLQNRLYQLVELSLYIACLIYCCFSAK